MPVVGKSEGQLEDGEIRLASAHVPALVTQFTPPPPPFGFVERPRLRERLERGLHDAGLRVARHRRLGLVGTR